MTHLSDIRTYTDDTQLYIPFLSYPDVSQADALHAIESCIKLNNIIKIWMTVDK